MRRWGRCLPPLIPMSLTLELRSWPARQHRALLLPYANQTVNAAQKREGGSQRGESFSVGHSSQYSPIITWPVKQHLVRISKVSSRARKGQPYWGLRRLTIVVHSYR